MLEFPDYISIEDEIIDILKSRNKRLYLALPLLLIEKFDYNRIIKRLDKKLHKEFDKIIGITAKIFKLEGIDNQLPRGKFDKGDFEYYYSSFKQFIASKEKKDEEDLKESIRIRSKLNINKASSTIFAPGKLRIMNQIFNHEKLTNTELKYYYRSKAFDTCNTE